MNIASEFFSFNVWEWFLHSSVLERTESTYQRLPGFMASFYFILIVLVPWGRFSDVDQPRNTRKDPLHVPNGPMTRSKTKALKETLNALVLNVSTKSELKGPLEYQEETLVHLIHVQEGSNTTLFRAWGENNKGNRRILLQLGNNMGGYLFLLFLGLRGCMEGYK
jgi:hypothetical protein